MAHGRPWYQRNGGDIVMAVLHFPDNDHRWAYSAIIDILNDRDRPLADDPAFICGFTRITKQKWAKVRAYLLEHGYLLLTDDGRLTNPRFEREAAKRAQDHEKAVEAGRTGGRRSAAKRQAELELGENLPTNLKESDQQTSKKVGNFSDNDAKVLNGASPENNHLAEPPPQATRARAAASEARGERIEESSPTTLKKPAGEIVVGDGPSDLLGLTHAYAKLGGVAMVNPTSHATNMDVVKAWQAAGYSDDLIRETIKHQLTNTKQDRIGSLNFYSSALARRHAAGGGLTTEQRQAWTPERQRKAITDNIALYRKLGRVAEADAMQAELDKAGTG